MQERTGPGLEPGFQGRIGRTVSDSVPYWPDTAPDGRSPNVVVILLDDVGFAQLGCYGSSIATPNIDALADGGVRYTNFHVAALCSPTRASLLTGRNHHAVGAGFLGAFDTGFPGYRGAISHRATTLAEMLRTSGYSSYAVGKWHLTPPAHMTPSGPFDHWPTQRGFDRYYGFLWGEDDQWAPELWYDQHRVDVPDRPGYHVSEDFVDRAQEFIADHLTGRPDHPFFCYLAFGACHAPHQAPRDVIERYAGAFDHGWDVERERVLERQVALGVVPEGTELSPRNPGVPAWDELDDDERRLAARLQEAFAGFMEHTDAQIGRLVAFLQEQGELDDTVILLMSDNGASGEGGRTGSINEYRYFLNLEDSPADALAVIDEIGGPSTHNHYPSGWAQAGNTPLKLYKRYAHGGGVRAPLVTHWPKGLQPGGVRHQFHHVIDIVPTVLDLVGITPPTTYHGVEQMPVHGSSMRYSFDDVDTPSPRDVQYFETAGHRAIYADGWKAVAAHEPGTDFDDDRWELYRIEEDFAEIHDRAAELPERVTSMTDRWWAEAEAYDVLPLDDRMGTRVAGLDPATDRRSYTMLPGTRLLNHVAGPSFAGRPFTVSAHVRRGGEGVLLAYGRRAFGFSLYVRDGRLVFDYNLAGRHTVVRTDSPLPTSDVVLAVRIDEPDDTPCARLLVDGRVEAETPLPQLVPAGIGTLSIQCGHNAPSPVSADYTAPFEFDGDLQKVVVELDPRLQSTTDVRVASEIAFQ